MTTDERRARVIAQRWHPAVNWDALLPAVKETAMGFARAIRASDEAAGMVLVPRDVMEGLAPESPMNQDEQGGCVWCGGTPEGHPYGYASADPADHDHECPWVQARAMITVALEAEK